MKKKFLMDAGSFRTIAVVFGSCFATDRITVDGALVGYMYREEPRDNIDSGWSFFAGDEYQEYCDEPSNYEIYDVNTIANYDPTITPFLEAPAGTAFIRRGDTFVIDGEPG